MFTKISKIIAKLIVVFSLIRIAIAVYLASTLKGEELARASADYLAGPTGPAIDQGIKYLLVGILIGVLAEISEKLTELNSKNNNSTA